MTRSAGGANETPGDEERRSVLCSSRLTMVVNGVAGIMVGSFWGVDGDERNESWRKRPRGLSRDDLDGNNPEPDDLMSSEPLRPRLGDIPAVRWRRCSAFLERNDMIPDGDMESRNRLLPPGGGARSIMGVVGYDRSEVDGRDLETVNVTLESARKYCSRIRERCTYIAIRSTLAKALYSSVEVTPLKAKVPPTIRIESSSGGNIATEMGHLIRVYNKL